MERKMEVSGSSAPSGRFESLRRNGSMDKNGKAIVKKLVDGGRGSKDK